MIRFFDFHSRLRASLACAAVIAVTAMPDANAQNAAPAKVAEKIPVADETGFIASALWDGRKVMPFRAQDNPKMVAANAASAFLNDDEYILGVTVNGESRAYPTRFVWFHHVVNDSIGKSSQQNVAVTYCSVCNTGLTFVNAVDGKSINLDFYGLYNGVVALADRATESALTQVNGQFVTGPLKGKSLQQVTTLDTTWGRWRKLHPDTLVMAPEEQNSKFYKPKGVAEARGYPSFPAPYFAPSVTRHDDRLPMFDKVLGVVVSGRGVVPGLTQRAYPIKTLKAAGDVVNDVVTGAPVVVWIEGDTDTANAFVGEVDGKRLTFEQRSGDGRRAFYDRETGSEWNVEGVCVFGKMRGKSLNRIANHLSQWYGWSAFYPKTQIYVSYPDPTGK